MVQVGSQKQSFVVRGVPGYSAAFTHVKGRRNITSLPGALLSLWWMVVDYCKPRQVATNCSTAASPVVVRLTLAMCLLIWCLFFFSLSLMARSSKACLLSVQRRHQPSSIVLLLEDRGAKEVPWESVPPVHIIH